MAGHNKWSKVKRLKAVTDKRKGALFSKTLNEIMLAAKSSTDPASNFRLRKAISDAKAQSIPKDNIDRAIKKGSGELNDGVTLEELIYEGFGPGGVAFMVECVTDNRNRTQPELKKIFEKAGGMMGEMGSVAWSFEKKGQILVSRDKAKEEDLMNLVLEAGADDLKTSEDGYEILVSPPKFESVRQTLETQKIPVELAEITFVPTNKVPASADLIEIIDKLSESLEDHADVQRVVHNADI
ncbi:MAG: hypothetical protein JWQ35_1145 [Bacteriovoracaceae bacterium]|nr:hypothetical protein [Bacteriovoracaceae bacterium]